MTSLNESTLDELAPLWHYDPWWLLKDERFESEWAVPILKSTNCADAFERQPADLLFSTCLTQLRMVRFPVPAESQEDRRYRPEMLPAREMPAFAHMEQRATGWHLDPWWADPKAAAVFATSARPRQ